MTGTWSIGVTRSGYPIAVTAVTATSRSFAFHNRKSLAVPPPEDRAEGPDRL